ncbi:hypothetical protein JCM3765_002203 [Sporobolomyces pararoseus]
MLLFEWHHRRTHSSAAALPIQTSKPNRKGIPTLTIQVEDHSAIPFPSSHSTDATQSDRTNFLSKLRRVASCLSFSSSSSSASSSSRTTPSTISTTPQSHLKNKRETSLSVQTSPIDLKKRKELKSFISYPTLRSSSSPVSPQSSSIGGVTWGVRKSMIMEEEEEENQRRNSSIYGGFEELLDLSLCPPHLFPGDSQDHHSKGRPSIGSEDSVSLSVFDDRTLLFHSPPPPLHSTTTYYPHQPTVGSAFSPSTTPARSRSTSLSTTRSLSISSSVDGERELETEFEGFSWCPTPPTSVFNTPARSIVFKLDDEDVEEEQQTSRPTTPKLNGVQLEASPSSFLALPPRYVTSTRNLDT